MRYHPETALEPLRRGGASGVRGRPFVVGQLGQSLDGRIATPTGKSKYISGKAALAHLHRLRAAVDAVIVGVDTVIADDPQLTVRMAPGRSPLRVIIDPSGRLPLDRRCLAPCADTSALLVRATDAPTAGLPPGVAELRLARGEDGAIPPAALLAALGARGAQRVLIEGGATTLSRALDAGCVDLLHVTVSPIILGSGVAGLRLEPIDELGDGLHPASTVHAFPDGDILFACDLRRRRAGAPPASYPSLDIRVAAAE